MIHTIITYNFHILPHLLTYYCTWINDKGSCK